MAARVTSTVGIMALVLYVAGGCLFVGRATELKRSATSIENAYTSVAGRNQSGQEGRWLRRIYSRVLHPPPKHAQFQRCVSGFRGISKYLKLSGEY